MKIIVTGGCGFIGSNFILNQLRDGKNKKLRDKYEHANSLNEPQQFKVGPAQVRREGRVAACYLGHFPSPLVRRVEVRVPVLVIQRQHEDRHHDRHEHYFFKNFRSGQPFYKSSRLFLGREEPPRLVDEHEALPPRQGRFRLRR